MHFKIQGQKGMDVGSRDSSSRPPNSCTQDSPSHYFTRPMESPRGGGGFRKVSGNHGVLANSPRFPSVGRSWR